MGRGGDQAVVRQKDGQKFFGGMTTTTENNTRVRARLIAYALKELIMESDRVLLMGHANPDLDCFGAALGMYRAVFELKKTGTYCNECRKACGGGIFIPAGE